MSFARNHSDVKHRRRFSVGVPFQKLKKSDQRAIQNRTTSRCRRRGEWMKWWQDIDSNADRVKWSTDRRAFHTSPRDFLLALQSARPPPARATGATPHPQPRRQGCPFRNNLQRRALAHNRPKDHGPCVARAAMNNEQFRKLIAANGASPSGSKNGPSPPSAGASSSSGAALGSRQRAFVPMTP